MEFIIIDFNIIKLKYDIEINTLMIYNEQKLAGPNKILNYFLIKILLD